MSSTGEVGCLGEDTNDALLKAMLSVGQRIPKKNILLSTGGAKEKAETLDAAKMLLKHGYKLYATVGTSKYLTENGVENTLVYWPSDEAQRTSGTYDASQQANRPGGEHPEGSYGP